jgi:phosphotransferase system enzyme I (PtsI)
MIGIVVVSHSPALAHAAVDLAVEMVSGQAPKIEVAAGAGDDIIGTDAVRVSEAIEKVAGPDGVLVFTDLGSAVLSAQMAVEFAGVEGVVLTDAPFVEGLTAAVVSAAQGRSVQEVDREARGALRAKTAQLAPPEESVTPDGGAADQSTRTAVEGTADGGGQAAPAGHSGDPSAPDARSETMTLHNPSGLHARPAALLVGALTGLKAQVWVHKPGGAPIEVTGTTALLILGARQGDTVTFHASGEDGSQALSRIMTLVRDGFGELDAAEARTASAGAESVSPQGTGATEDRQAGAASRPGPLGVSPGLAIAPIVRLAEAPGIPQRHTIAVAERESEKGRLASAFAAVAGLYRSRAKAKHGGAAQILAATATIADDAGLLADARQRVHDHGDNAEFAVWQTFETATARLIEAGGIVAERAADVRDVRDRIIGALAGVGEGAEGPGARPPERPDRYILVATDLAPADTAELDSRHCVGIVTAGGGPTSHTAILARDLGIPAVVAAPEALDFPDGAELFLDGETGRLVLEPDDALRRSVGMQRTIDFDGTGRTADGRRVSLLANIGAVDDAAAAARLRAEGVGLLRTEFLFLGRTSAPGTDEQVTAYRRVLSAFPGKKVVVRTLDAGADKPLPFMNISAEANPALGVRGLRTAVDRPEIFSGQLEAIVAAARQEDAIVQVMAPMVATVEEGARFAQAVHDAGLPLAGVMIETPAAALMAEELFTVVDFVSLGTNDLSQYTMAADRLSGALAALNDPWQPAVLRLIRTVGQAGQAAGKPVGVCGEAAADPLLAAVLVGFGVTSLSMTPRALGRVATQLKDVPFARCLSAARAAADADSAAAARDAAAAVLRA